MNTSMGMWLLTAISGVFLIQGVFGYPSGAPNRACVGMAPFHRNQSPQTSTPPYSISFDRASYSVNGIVSVTISGCDTQIFQGFMLQARRVDVNSDRVAPVGYFDIPPGTRYVSGCGAFSQVTTHQGDTDKRSITFQWTAPEQSEGDIVFIATFLESYTTFWVKLNSGIIQDETRTTRGNVGSEVYPSPSVCQSPSPSTSQTQTGRPTFPTQTETPVPQPQPGRPITQFPSPTTQTTAGTPAQSADPDPPSGTPTTTVSRTLPVITTTPTRRPTQRQTTPPLSATTTVKDDEKELANSTAPTSPRPDCGESNLNGDLQDSTSQTPECGESKWCYRWCPGGECIFNLTTQYTESDISIELSSRIASTRPQWIAVGFSYDTKMGDDSVVECVLADDGRVNAYTSFNEGIENIRIGKEGITSSSGGVTDGTLNCIFNRLSDVDTEPRIFDLENNTDWYIFLASGDMDASLMLVAWVFTTSLGMIVARYYKLLGGSVTCFNDRYSFHVHRACMTLTFICVCISIIVIFVDVGGYSRISPIEGLLVQAHPILGIVVTALVVLNFSMGLLRPAPGRTVRPLYNWAHWATGTVAWIAAIVTILLGFAIERVKVHPAATYVFVGFVILHLLIQVSLEWLSCHVVNTQMDTPNKPLPDRPIFELTTMDSQTNRHNGILEIQQHTVTGVGKLKAVILVLYTFALAFILFALLVLVNNTFEQNHE